MQPSESLSIDPATLVRLACVAWVAMIGTHVGCAGSSTDSAQSIDGREGPAAPAATDPITLWSTDDFDAAIDGLKSSLQANGPVLPPPLRISEQEFVSNLKGLPQEAERVKRDAFMQQHQKLRDFASAIAQRADEAWANNNAARAERLARLITRFGQRLQDPQYTSLTQAYGRGIVEFGSERLERYAE